MAFGSQFVMGDKEWGGDIRIFGDREDSLADINLKGLLI